MSEVKDPKIKLFGKTIQLPEMAESGGVVSSHSCDTAGEDNSHQDSPRSSDSMLEHGYLNSDAEERESNKGLSDIKQDDGKEEDQIQPSASEELKDELEDSKVTLPIIDGPTAPSADNDSGVVKSPKTEEDPSETTNSQEKTLKKPDKILPCPRCNSMDTKFCYFNNYNVNQPRHFCKNCQRYWTAGGTMRNVPIGAGRRKNKNATSQFRHLSVQESLESARVDLPNVIHHRTLNPNGTVLTFSSDTPLCESMASVLNIADKTILNSSRNGFHRSEVGISVSPGSKENGDESLGGSSTNAASSNDDISKSGLPEIVPNFHPIPPHVPCFPGAPWPFPWNSVQWNTPASPPTLSPASFPMPFLSMASPYWGFAVPSAWNVPWVLPPTATTLQSHAHQNSGPNSPTLGKHSRDDDILKSTNGKEEETQKDISSEKCLWIPKTLRIDDPGEAAKSSIWETLGIKNASSVNSVGRGGLFKPFQSQSYGDEKSQVPEASTILQANPAALSRSLSFHESS